MRLNYGSVAHVIPRDSGIQIYRYPRMMYLLLYNLICFVWWRNYQVFDPLNYIYTGTYVPWCTVYMSRILFRCGSVFWKQILTQCLVVNAFDRASPYYIVYRSIFLKLTYQVKVKVGGRRSTMRIICIKSPGPGYKETSKCPDQYLAPLENSIHDSYFISYAVQAERIQPRWPT